MIKIILIILAVIAGLIFGPEISANKGYILISFDSYTTYEMTIINAAFIALAFYFLLLFVEWVLRHLLSMSAVTRGWIGQRKTRKAHKRSILGMWALYEGKNKQAHKLLSKSAARSESPALTYIAAARAAHLQGLYDLRNEHLVLAHESNKDAHLSVGLVSVELQIDAKQYEGALATLRDLALKFPSNPRIAQLYLDIYPALNEWEKYIRVLNNHYKQLDYNAEEIAQLELNAYQHYFKQLALEDVESLKLFWEKKLPRRLRKELSYQEAMLDAYIETDNAKYAAELLIEKLNKQFSLPLLAYLDKIVLSDYDPLIELLERKLKRFEEKSLILQTLAKLKLKENDPEGAIKDLELSLESESSVESCALLARLLEEQERFDDANRYYRQGLLLATKASTEVIKLP